MGNKDVGSMMLDVGSFSPCRSLAHPLPHPKHFLRTFAVSFGKSNFFKLKYPKTTDGK